MEEVNSSDSDSSLDLIVEDPCLCQSCPDKSIVEDGSSCCKYMTQSLKRTEAAGVACVTLLPKFLKMMDEACINISCRILD